MKKRKSYRREKRHQQEQQQQQLSVGVSASASSGAQAGAPFDDNANIIFGDADIGAVDQASIPTLTPTAVATTALGSASTSPVATNPNQNNSGFSAATFFGGNSTIFGLPTVPVLLGVVILTVGGYLILKK